MGNIYTLPYKPLIKNDTSLICPNTWIGKNVRIGEGVIIEENCQIGNNVIIGHYTVLRPGTIIGDNTVLAHHIVCEGDTTIGNHVTVQSQSHLTKGMTVEDNVFIAHGVFTANTVNIKHGRKNIDLNTKGQIIEHGARIGCRATLYPGVIVGENALIGMGSLVVKDIPARQVWYGSPARYVRDVPEDQWL